MDGKQDGTTPGDDPVNETASTPPGEVTAGNAGDSAGDDTAAKPPADGTPAVAETAELPAGEDAAQTDIFAVRRPRPSSSNPDDPFGPEPAWLQHGSGKRTALGVGLTVVLLGVVAALGWWAFRPDQMASSSEGDGEAEACQVTEHDDDGLAINPPTLGSAQARQTATVTTNFGAITVLLFGDVAPCGVGGFGYLAEQGFYANSTCHRVTTQPIDPTVTLRCGDPTGTGKGGPGFRYRAEQEFTGRSGANYFAMINDRSGRAGSSFAFIRGESQPTARMSVVGTVIDGFDILDQIGGSAGLKFDDAPPQPVTILSVTIEEGTITLPPSDEPDPGSGSSGTETNELPGQTGDTPTDGLSPR